MRSPRWGLLATVRGYAKYNTDQIAIVKVLQRLPINGQQYDSYRNSNWETLKGVEIKISSTMGRYFYGWATYEYVSRASGQIGYNTLQNEPTQAVTTWPAEPVTSDSPDNFQALLGARTPREWGPLTGGWGLSVVQTWQEGNEVVYNPNAQERYLLPPEYFMKRVDYWNTDLKLTKAFNLPGGRSVSVYMDITNLFNAKRLNLGGTAIYGICHRSQDKWRRDGPPLRRRIDMVCIHRAVPGMSQVTARAPISPGS